MAQQVAKRHSYRFDGDFSVGGKPLLLTHTFHTWDAGIALAKYLEQQHRVDSDGQRFSCLELGAGTGVAGLSLALLGHSAILSDIGTELAEATLGHIEQNRPHIEAAGGSAGYVEMDWRGLPDRANFDRFDVVLAADVIWNAALVEPFVHALAWAASGPGTREVLLAHKVRNEVCDLAAIARFERLAKAAGFLITKCVSTDVVLGSEGHPKVFVYHLQPV